MFNLKSGNTWVFTGGANAQGGWAQTKGARNFVGHFEEHIRWEKRDNDHVETMERYVINTAKTGQTIEHIKDHFEQVVAVYQSKAVAVLVGAEDYMKGQVYIEAFKNNLKELVNKIQSMNALPVLQTPVPAKEELLNQEAARYREVMIELAREDESILLIDHFKMCEEKGLSYEEGQLDQVGHLEIGRQLMEATIGDSTPFTLEEVVEEPKTWLSWEIVESHSGAAPIKKLVESNKERPLRWLFVGDSITHGALHTHGYDSFPQLFEKFIRDEKGRVNDVVINTGVSGAKAKDQFDHYQARFETYKNLADVVFIMFGTNDSGNDVTLDAFRSYLRKMIADIKAVGAIPVLRVPNTWQDDLGNRNERLDPYVPVIEECAKEAQIVLIHHYDQWMKAASHNPSLVKRGGWIAEGDGSGIHPGALGQLSMFHTAIQCLDLWDEESEMARLTYKIKAD